LNFNAEAEQKLKACLSGSLPSRYILCVVRTASMR
jgi:hypothetical protein